MYAAHKRKFHLPYLLRLCGCMEERERETLLPSGFFRRRICNLSSHSPLGEVSSVLLKQPLHQPGSRDVSDVNRAITSGLTSPPSVLACN